LIINTLDYKFIKIKNYYELNYDGFVYDFEINNYHNYIANNIISHNTCTSISIAENFKDQIIKYNTKIYILVPGPIIKENWMNELISCTGNTYLKNTKDKNVELYDTNIN